MKRWNEWRFVSATVTGTSHTKAQSPCQDSHVSEIVDGHDEALVLVASDGAGSATRSDFGANLACVGLLNSIKGFLGAGNKVADLTEALALSWYKDVVASIEQVAASEELEPRDFACTLLVAVVSATHAAFMQVGDGAIVFRPEGDEWMYMFWPQHGEYINTTLFITDPNALMRFEFCCGRIPVEDIAVFTDGIEPLVLHYATQTVHSPFFDNIFRAVRSLGGKGRDESLSLHLSRYLESPIICDRTDDDKTLLLATRCDCIGSESLLAKEV